MKGTIVALVSTLILVTGLASAACGSDAAGPSLKEYFQNLQAVMSEDEESSALEAQLEGEMVSADTIEERVAASKEYFTLALAEIQEVLAELSDLDPPSEAASAHDAQVNGLRDVATSTEALIADFDAVQSEREWEVLVNGYVVSFEPLRPACRELETIATANGIELELKCELSENQ